MRKGTILLILTLSGLLLAGCSDSVEYITYNIQAGNGESQTVEPRLTRLEFLAADNPELLVDDVACSIMGDSVAECWVPHVMSGKRLVARFKVAGGKVLADGERMESGVTAVDFSWPVRLTVVSGIVDSLQQDAVLVPEPLRHDYTVYVHAFTGLPVLWIETEGEAPIESKEEYVRASFRLTEDVVTRGLQRSEALPTTDVATQGLQRSEALPTADVVTRSPGDVIEVIGRIRGRGNSTWSLPKKPYRLKLDTKTALLGMPADKSWVLLANYSDKTMLRNAVALRMGGMSNIGYTPRAHFVELMLNGRYDGTYQLCEKLELARHRVDVGGDGFLLEIDQRAKEAEDGPLVRVAHIKAPICIKEPDVTADSEDYAYVSRFLAEADSALFSNGFTNPVSGWRKYLDMDSFVDWYLVNEIAKNNDAWFFASCYMNLQRESTAGGTTALPDADGTTAIPDADGRLRMGPLWDFDLAFGNILYNNNFEPEGFCIKSVPWYARLMRDPEFLARVKDRFDYFYSRRDDILAAINEDARYLSRASTENENRWGTLYEMTWQNHDAWGSYQNEVQHLKTWLTHRMDWLRDEFAKM